MKIFIFGQCPLRPKVLHRTETWPELQLQRVPLHTQQISSAKIGETTARTAKDGYQRLVVLWWKKIPTATLPRWRNWKLSTSSPTSGQTAAWRPPATSWDNFWEGLLPLLRLHFRRITTWRGLWTANARNPGDILLPLNPVRLMLSFHLVLGPSLAILMADSLF